MNIFDSDAPQNNLKYARIACQLFEVLISSPAGYSFLESHPILGQLSAALKIESDTVCHDLFEEIAHTPLLFVLTHSYTS